MKRNDYDDPTKRPTVITTRAFDDLRGKAVTKESGVSHIAGYMTTREMSEEMKWLRQQRIAVWNVEV